MSDTNNQTKPELSVHAYRSMWDGLRKHLDLSSRDEQSRDYILDLMTVMEKAWTPR